jgi:hypothetical protein
MRGLWVVVCAVAACGDGIYIEVSQPPGVRLDRVELFVGDRDCRLGDGDETCAGIQPPVIDRFLGSQGDLWFTANEHDDFSAEVVDGVATFQIGIAKGEAQIIAIGTSNDQQGVLAAGVLIPIDLIESPVRYKVQLSPVEPLRQNAGPGTPGTVGFALWQNPTTGVRCVGADDYTTSRGPVFVLPESDPDCDNVRPDRECDPLDHLATPTTDPDARPNCVEAVQIVDATVCMLGVFACDERPQATSSCGRTDDVCISSHVCAECIAKAPSDFGFCARKVLSFEDPTATPAHFECPMEVEADKQGHFRPCANGAGFPQLVAGASGAILQRSCTALQLASLESPFVEFEASVTLDTGNGNEITLGSTPLAGMRCDFSLDWSGQIDAATVSSASPQVLLAGFGLDSNGGGPERGMVFPVVLKYQNGCTGEPKICVFKPDPNDAIAGCGE